MFCLCKSCVWKRNVTDIETLSEDTLVFILRWCEKLREINKKQYRILFENEVYNIICVDDVQFTHKKLKTDSSSGDTRWKE
mgnify:CR=1 FL=1